MKAQRYMQRKIEEINFPSMVKRVTTVSHVRRLNYGGQSEVYKSNKSGAGKYFSTQNLSAILAKTHPTVWVLSLALKNWVWELVI